MRDAPAPAPEVPEVSSDTKKADEGPVETVAQPAPGPPSESAPPTPPVVFSIGVAGGVFLEPAVQQAGLAVVAAGELALRGGLSLGLTATLDSAIVGHRDSGHLSEESRFFGAQLRLTTLSWSGGSVDVIVALGAEWLHASSAGYVRDSAVDLLSPGLQSSLAVRQRIARFLEVFLSVGARARRAERLEVEGVGTLLELSPFRPHLVIGLSVIP